MTRVHRPHLLGIDDGPFVKGAQIDVPIVGVMMEGPDLVEGVAVTRFPVDGPDVTGFLARWITGLRLRPALHGIVLGGITIAGLGVVDITALAEATGTAVLAVSRRDTKAHRLAEALHAAGLADRQPIVDRTPPAFALGDGTFAACAGTTSAHAEALLHAARAKADLPEALRVAHLIARAVVSGESRGRV